MRLHKMAKHTHTSVGPDGTLAKRTTERTYTHVVWVKRAKNVTQWEWAAVSWASSRLLADRAGNRWHSAAQQDPSYICDVRVYSVNS